MTGDDPMTVPNVISFTEGCSGSFAMHIYPWEIGTPTCRQNSNGLVPLVKQAVDLIVTRRVSEGFETKNAGNSIPH